MDEYFYLCELIDNGPTINLTLNLKARQGYRVVEFKVIGTATDMQSRQRAAILMQYMPPDPTQDRTTGD